MKNKVFITSVLATFMFLLTTGIFAQDKDSKMKDMKMDKNPQMAEMMKGEHHQVMTAYKGNLLNLAKTLENVAKDSDSINAEFAKAIFTDIERSNEMMGKVHQDHMSKMDSKMMEKMAPMMDKMKTQQTELKHHIMALGKEINADSINSKEVENHASAIVGLLEGKKMKDMDHNMDDM